MSSGSAKKVTPPVPAPAPTILSDTSDTVMAAADEQRKKLKTSGYRGSMLSGVLGAPAVEKKTLLG